jgi:hypothetical protein
VVVADDRSVLLGDAAAATAATATACRGEQDEGKTDQQEREAPHETAAG